MSSIHSESAIPSPPVSRQASSGRSESVPRTIRKMKITARVESPSPVSRTPTPAPQTDHNNNCVRDTNTKPVTRNFMSPNPTQATSNTRIGWPQTDNVEEFPAERVKSPTLTEGVRSASPAPGGRQEMVRSPVMRVRSPVPFRTVRRGTESDLPPTPQSRVQSPLPSRLQSPTPLQTEEERGTGRRGSVGGQLFCDQTSKQEKKVQEWRLDSLSQEVVIKTFPRI